jgi:hypothetical protein
MINDSEIKMKSFRILLVLPSRKGETGLTIGFERMAALIASMIEVYVVHTGELRLKSRLLRRLPKFLGNSILSFLFLLRNDYDVVWTPSVLSLASFVVLVKRVARFRFKFVLDLHGLPTERAGYIPSLLQVLLGAVVRCSDMVWYIDDQRLATFAMHYNIKSFLVPTPIDIKVFRPDYDRRKKSRSKLQLGKAFCVGIIGPFDKYYNGPGLSFVLQHLGSLPDSAKLLVVGEHAKIEPLRSDKVLFTGKV